MAVTSLDNKLIQQLVEKLAAITTSTGSEDSEISDYFSDPDEDANEKALRVAKSTAKKLGRTTLQKECLPGVTVLDVLKQSQKKPKWNHKHRTELARYCCVHNLVKNIKKSDVVELLGILDANFSDCNITRDYGPVVLDRLQARVASAAEYTVNTIHRNGVQIVKHQGQWIASYASYMSDPDWNGHHNPPGFYEKRGQGQYQTYMMSHTMPVASNRRQDDDGPVNHPNASTLNDRSDGKSQINHTYPLKWKEDPNLPAVYP